jgi:hypothetical protein
MDYSAFLQGPFIVAIIIGLALGYGLLYLNLLTYHRALLEVKPSNRMTEPGNVWLMFIPLFSLVYAFILYPRICDSIRNEYKARGMRADGDFGRNIGIAMPILSLCGWIPVLGGLAGLTNIVLWIIFWSKISGYRNILKNSPSQQSAGSVREDILD